MATPCLVLVILVTPVWCVNAHWLNGDEGSDRVGESLTEIALSWNSSSPECARHCLLRGECKAWSFCRSGSNETQTIDVPVCFLKTSPGRQVRSPGCSSGVKDVTLLTPFWRRLRPGSVRPRGWAKEEARRQAKAVLSRLNDHQGKLGVKCEQKILRELTILSEQLELRSLRQKVLRLVQQHAEKMQALSDASPEFWRRREFREKVWKEFKFIPALVDYFDIDRSMTQLSIIAVRHLRLVRALAWEFPYEWKRMMSSCGCCRVDTIAAIQRLLLDDVIGDVVDEHAQFLLAMSATLAEGVECKVEESNQCSLEERISGHAQRDLELEACTLRLMVIHYLSSGRSECLTVAMEHVVHLLDREVMAHDAASFVSSCTGNPQEERAAMVRLYGHLLSQLMQTFSALLAVTSNMAVVEWLELVAFNFLPAAINNEMKMSFRTPDPILHPSRDIARNSSQHTSLASPMALLESSCPAATNGLTHFMDGMVLQSTTDNTLIITSFAPSETIVTQNGHRTKLTIESEYPYNNDILIYHPVDKTNRHLPPGAVLERHVCQE